MRESSLRPITNGAGTLPDILSLTGTGKRGPPRPQAFSMNELSNALAGLIVRASRS